MDKKKAVLISDLNRQIDDCKYWFDILSGGDVIGLVIRNKTGGSIHDATTQIRFDPRIREAVTAFAVEKMKQIEEKLKKQLEEL